MTEKEEKSVKEQDMLFATLDTQHRKISLEPGADFILIDTVGFVSKLPHSLVEAFKSTLDEVKYADLLIHVVDAAYDERDFQIEVTDNVIKQLGAGAKEKLMAYNKMDIAMEKPLDVSSSDAVYISAATGENMDQLIKKIKERNFRRQEDMPDFHSFHMTREASPRICAKMRRLFPLNILRRELS